jgi:trimeric autotransporter adhesin
MIAGPPPLASVSNFDRSLLREYPPMTRFTTFRRHPIAPALLVSASLFAYAQPAMAASVLYSNQPSLAKLAEAGERVTQQGGLSQFRLENGGLASFTEGASFRLREDGSIDLFSGTVTVAGGDDGAVVVHLAETGEGRVEGRQSAASFTVDQDADGKREMRGHAMTGTVTIRIGADDARGFTAGQMWRSTGSRAELVVAIGAQAVPAPDAEADVADMATGGVLAAAENGVPVVLGDALAAAGANGDIIAAARRVESAVAQPALTSFPSGDLALLVAYAGQLESVYGGRPFNGAAADIIRTYLQFLAGGGSGAQFLTAYAGLTLQYLDLLRSSAMPSAFSGASQDQINSFIAFRSRTAGFADLAASNRTLVEAYLAFLQGGGRADQFVPRYTNLTDAYFAFVRGGGDPAAFTGASQQTINAYLIFLRDAGLLARLTDQNRALLQAYLASLAQGGNGFAFTDQYRAALGAYFTYLQQGRLPSAYTTVDAATLRSYLETLQATGLFNRVLGTQAEFYAGYLSWLRGGGSIDGYNQLPANIFAGYASALSAYYEYLRLGGIPSAYTVLTQAQIRAYLSAISAAGANSRFLGDLTQFWTDFFAYLAGGGNPDLYAGLPAINFPAYANALNAYAAYLAGGGLPSGYTALTLAQLRAYIDAIIAAGRLNELLGANAVLLRDYFAHLRAGGAPNGFAGLPVYTNYASALNAYYAFLINGGFPTDYTGLTLAQLQAYLQALIDAGVFSQLFSGATASFLQAYYTHVSTGGAPNQFAQLPAVIRAGGGGGGGGSTAGYRGGFTATSGIRLAAAIGSNGGGVSADNQLTVNSDGSYSSTTARLLPGTARFTDVGGDSRGVVGRLHNGSPTFFGQTLTYGANNGASYVLMAPIVGSFPTSGSILYDIVSATRPVYDDGSTAPGTFAATFAVGFGSTLRYAINGTITMPDATYTVTAGNPATGVFANTQVSSTTFFVARPTVSAGPGCPSGCQLNMFGAFGGENPQQRLGLAYHTMTGAAPGKTITGAVLFGQQGTIVDPAKSGTLTNQSVAYANSLIGVDAYANVTVSYDPTTGSPTSYRVDNNENLAVGTAFLADTGRAGSVLSWARWVNGLPSGNYFGSRPQSVGANNGYHIIAGSPMTNMPASGTVAYTLIGQTRPTFQDGRSAPGTLSGSAAVAFGSTPRVGLDLTVSIGGQSYGVRTNGGVTTPSSSGLTVGANGAFNSLNAGFNALTVSSTSPVCSVSCNAFVDGFLAGNGASHLGISYSIRGNPNNVFIDGTAAFAASAGASSASAQPASATASMPATAAAIPATSVAPTPVPGSGLVMNDNWVRWSNPGIEGAILPVAATLQPPAGFISFEKGDAVSFEQEP